jgi:hypothetical protein
MRRRRKMLRVRVKVWRKRKGGKVERYHQRRKGKRDEKERNKDERDDRLTTGAALFGQSVGRSANDPSRLD